MTEHSRKLSRRSFLLGRFLGGRSSESREKTGLDAPMRYLVADSRNEGSAGPGHGRLAAASIPVFRPPGAIEEQAFLDSCDRNGACIEACPHDSLVLAPERLRSAAGTPVFDPVSQPCWFCDDPPCIRSCTTGALVSSVEACMGTARIIEQTCLAHQGTFCSTCMERCPVEGAIVTESGRPVVNESICVGCGVCLYVCPAPQNAILLMPTFRRPLPEAGNG